MCVPGLFGGGRSAPPAPPTPAPPTTPPAPMPIQQAPTPIPEAPTPAPVSEDETKRKAKVKAKKVAKKGQGQTGTTSLQTRKPESGGLSGITTPQGTNTSGGGSAGGSY
tara:strand:- start:12654 stop:12980 length:327 start_codon:yes stop_codon:yes gene_type:complete